MKKKIVIIGANEFQHQLIEKAKNKGIETHVFAWEEGAVGKEISDYFYPISIRNVEEIIHICKKIDPDGVASVASDLAMPTVNSIAEKFNLVGNSTKSIKYSTNKYFMRKILEESNINCPKYKIMNSSRFPCKHEYSFPLIIKPIDRSGSRGVKKVENYSQMKIAINEAFSYSFTDKILIEEYIKGTQYSVETISFKGNHKILGITEEFYTGAPYFVEKCHILPGRISKEQKNILMEIVTKSLDAIDYKNGAAHTEVRITEDGTPVIIEIAGRMGGDFRSDLIELNTGIDYLGLVIDVAMGETIHENDYSNINNLKSVMVYWIINNNDLQISNSIIKNNYNRIVRYDINRRKFNENVTNSSERGGYIIIQSDNIDDNISLINQYGGNII